MKYSSVNQAMQTVSTIAKVGLSIVLPDGEDDNNNVDEEDEDGDKKVMGVIVIRKRMTVLPLASLYWRLGRVLMVMPTMDTDTKMVESTL